MRQGALRTFRILLRQGRQFLLETPLVGDKSAMNAGDSGEGSG